MTEMDLVGADGTSRRVQTAWEYTPEGRIHRTWGGATTWDDADSVLHYSWSYDDPYEPTLATVTDPYGVGAKYTIGYEAPGGKPRLEKIDGERPSCGGTNRLYKYLTPSTKRGHPLLASEIVDGRGHRRITPTTTMACSRIASRRRPPARAGRLILSTTRTFRVPRCSNSDLQLRGRLS